MRKATLDQEFVAQKSKDSYDFTELRFAMIREVVDTGYLSDTSFAALLKLLAMPILMTSEDMHGLFSSLWDGDIFLNIEQIKELEAGFRSLDCSTVLGDNSYSLVDVVINLFDVAAANAIIKGFAKYDGMRAAVNFGYTELSRR